MSDPVCSILLAEGGGEFWQVAEAMWQSPECRPVMFVAAGIGVLVGLAVFPLGRRLVLALKPRGAAREAGAAR